MIISNFDNFWLMRFQIISLINLLLTKQKYASLFQFTWSCFIRGFTSLTVIEKEKSRVLLQHITLKHKNPWDLLFHLLMCTVSNKKTHLPDFETFVFRVYLRNHLSYKKVLYILSRNIVKITEIWRFWEIRKNPKTGDIRKKYHFWEVNQTFC